MTGTFRIEVLPPEHDRSGFACGRDLLDRYLREQASQDIRRRTSVCYVAIDSTTDAIAWHRRLRPGCRRKDDIAAALYQHHGFTALSGNGLEKLKEQIRREVLQDIRREQKAAEAEQLRQEKEAKKAAEKEAR